jgi:hypothetical protein
MPKSKQQRQPRHCRRCPGQPLYSQCPVHSRAAKGAAATVSISDYFDQHADVIQMQARREPQESQSLSQDVPSTTTLYAPNCLTSLVANATPELIQV